MPEIRYLAPHQPRPTTLPRTQQAQQSGSGATAGSHVSSSPGAGAFGQSQVTQARQTLSIPQAQQQHQAQQAQRPPTGRSQDARVQMIQRPGGTAHIGGGGGGGGTLLASNQRPTVTIIPRAPAGPAQTQIPPDGAPLLSLDEAMLVGHLLNEYNKGRVENADHVNAELSSNALVKMSATIRYLIAQAAAAQDAAVVAAMSAAAPVPTRVQGPPHYPSPAQVAAAQGFAPYAPERGYTGSITGQPAVQVLPNQPAVQVLPNQTGMNWGPGGPSPGGPGTGFWPMAGGAAPGPIPAATVIDVPAGPAPAAPAAPTAPTAPANAGSV